MKFSQEAKVTFYYFRDFAPTEAAERFSDRIWLIPPLYFVFSEAVVQPIVVISSWSEVTSQFWHHTDKALPSPESLCPNFKLLLLSSCCQDSGQALVWLFFFTTINFSSSRHYWHLYCHKNKNTACCSSIWDVSKTIQIRCHLETGFCSLKEKSSETASWSWKSELALMRYYLILLVKAAITAFDYS